MKKNKLKIIETYVYAKTLNLISTNTSTKNQSKEIVAVINSATEMSSYLLSFCENKINSEKLNDVSFLVLKNELESCNYNRSTIDNYLKICTMIKQYNNYVNFVV